ncbi:hypothetical protein TCSYLVIO_000367, partial [Trypanosoma cruzi]
AREQYSRQRLPSAVAAQCSVVRPQLHRHVDGLLRRLDSTHFASAFMHADDRTLVALCVDLRAFGAAMPAAVSVVAKWGAEHSLNVNAKGSGAALFCIASHGQSDEDTADHRLGGGKPRVNPTLCVCSAMRLIDTSILFRTSPSLQGRPCHAAVSCGWAQELVRPSTPCDPFSLDASTVRCTTAVRRPHRVRSPLASTAWRCGTATAAQHRSSHAY